MRISALKPVSRELPVTLPSGEATGIVLTLISKDNAAFRTAQKAIMTKSQDGYTPTIDELERMNCEMAAHCVTGWTGLEDENDQPIPFSHAKCVEIFMNPELTFIRESVEAFISMRAMFFRKSTGTTGPKDTAPSADVHAE